MHRIHLLYLFYSFIYSSLIASVQIIYEYIIKIRLWSKNIAHLILLLFQSIPHSWGSFSINLHSFINIQICLYIHAFPNNWLAHYFILIYFLYGIVLLCFFFYKIFVYLCKERERDLPPSVSLAKCLLQPTLSGLKPGTRTQSGSSMWAGGSKVLEPLQATSQGVHQQKVGMETRARTQTHMLQYGMWTSQAA